MEGGREGGREKNQDEDAHLLEILADPQRDRRPPIPVPRDVPVARVREPVAEAVVADVLRHPVR